MNRLRAWIYDAVIARMTAGWYRAVLERLPPGCRLLDVGIGTGAALLANADLIAARSLRVTGIDVDADYVERCRREVARRDLADRIEVRLESVYDHRGGPYDAAYFSGSFMLLPDAPGALRQVAASLAPGGAIWFTQTFEEGRSRLLELVKPMLRHLTTIDFGRVTYEADFRRSLAAGDTELQEIRVLRQSRRRRAILAVAVPGPAGAREAGRSQRRTGAPAGP